MTVVDRRVHRCIARSSRSCGLSWVAGAVLGSATGPPEAVVGLGMAARVVVVWVLTLPAAATVGAPTGWVAARSDGNALVATMLIVAARGAELGGEMRSCWCLPVAGCRCVAVASAGVKRRGRRTEASSVAAGSYSR